MLSSIMSRSVPRPGAVDRRRADGGRDTPYAAKWNGVMLVLSRKVGEKILIGDDIAVTVVRVAQGIVRIGIEAPKQLPIVREEIRQQGGSDDPDPQTVAHS